MHLFQNNFGKQNLKLLPDVLHFVTFWDYYLTLSLLKTHAYELNTHIPPEDKKKKSSNEYNLNLENITSFEFALASLFYMIQYAESS